MGKSILDYDPIVKPKQPEKYTKDINSMFNDVVDAVYTKNKNAIISFIAYKHGVIQHTAAQWKALKKTYKDFKGVKLLVDGDRYDIYCEHI